MSVPAPQALARRNSRGSLVGTLMISVLVVFMIVPDGFNYEWGQGMPTEGSAFARFTWLALLAFGAFVVGRQPGRAKGLMRQINPYLLLFVVLAVASVTWSADPPVTIRRLLRMVTILLDAMALALLPWGQNSFQNALRPILTVMLIGSIIFVMSNPRLAVEQSQSFELAGAWRGLATQKNGLGSIAATGTILWLQAWLNRESKLWMILIGGGAAVACLLGSRSSTSIMATAFACTLLLMLSRSPKSLRRYMPYLIGLFVMTLLVYSLAVLNLVPGLGWVLKPITSVTGKDLTFSGRTAIWQVINDHIAYHPLLGSGYGAYWTGETPASPSYDMIRRLYFYPTESHNGYLDTINDLGFVGGAVLVAFVLKYIQQGLRLFRTMRPQGALYLALIFQTLIANMSESRWFNVLTLEYVILTLATVSMGRLLWQQSLERKAWERAARAAAAVPAR